MIYRELGSSDIEVSAVAFGAWAIGGWMWGGADENDAIDAIHTSFDAGVNLIHGQGPVLQIAEGWTFDLPQKAHDTLDNRTDPTWPTTWFAPRCGGTGVFKDGYTVMNAWGANHGAFSFGHIGGDLITLAAMLRIPVCMHNVPEADIFRPSVWGAFGTADPEGADFRACANFGPIYGW
jgi:L-fucose/D-arabinose isomerase